MSDSIGLAEFLEQVKQELLRQEPNSADAQPVLLLDDVELEVKLTVSKEARGGLNLQVVQAGASGKQEDVHTVRLRLSPLLSRDDRLEELRRAGHWPGIVAGQMRATVKGDGDAASALLS